MESVWSKTTQFSPRPVQEQDLKTDVAVIGGGMAGILTAWHLKQAGIPTVVLEASQLASGQTKNTTAKITAQHGLIYDKLAQGMGEERAKQYAAWNQWAVEQYARLVEAWRIDCEFQRLPAYLFATDDPEPLKQELEAAGRAALTYAYTEETELPFPVAGAVRLDNQAQFHPLKFIKALAKDLTIYENTRVTRLEGDHTLITNRGKVQADRVVFACHFPFVNFPGFYFLRMHQERSYVLGFENAQKLNGVYLGVDGQELSLRNAGEWLLLGGGNHRTGENRGGGKYGELRQAAEKHWPGAREYAHWSAQDCMTLDGAPYIGRFTQDKPDWYVATGFNKWGMTSSMVAAKIVSELIAGADVPDAEVFAPSRFTPAASAKSLLDEASHAVKGLSRQPFAPARGTLEALPNGHGGVVEVNGDKLGVYKDPEGNLFAVSTRCPHLGCQLEWNPDEKTWDCPCHGSRFDYRGQLINNPAQEDLEHVLF